VSKLEEDFSDYLYHNTSVAILYNPALAVYGEVGESRRDFRVRCEQEAQRGREAELKKALAAMKKRVDGVEKKMRREERELEADEDELEARKREEMLSLGESALNLFSRAGRRRSTSAISRASLKRRMTKKAKADVEESLATIEDLEGQLEALEEEWNEQEADIGARWAETLEEIEEFEVTPRRTDVTVEFCGLAWVPVWQVVLEDGRQLELPARE